MHTKLSRVVQLPINRSMAALTSPPVDVSANGEKKKSIKTFSMTEYNMLGFRE